MNKFKPLQLPTHYITLQAPSEESTGSSLKELAADMRPDEVVADLRLDDEAADDLRLRDEFVADLRLDAEFVADLRVDDEAATDLRFNEVLDKVSPIEGALLSTCADSPASSPPWLVCTDVTICFISAR
jgi:hypothetical protein